jgi:hypothetical protein
MLGRAFLRQLFRKLGVQLGKLARLFEDRLLEFLVVQLGKGARLAVLVPPIFPATFAFPIEAAAAALGCSRLIARTRASSNSCSGRQAGELPAAARSRFRRLGFRRPTTRPMICGPA